MTARDDLWETVGLAVGSDWRTAVTQARSLGLDTIAVADPQAAAEARENFDGNVVEGQEAAVDASAATRPDTPPSPSTASSCSRPASARPSHLRLGESTYPARRTRRAGRKIRLVTELAAQPLLPVDSEHSALFQLVETRIRMRSNGSS